MAILIPRFILVEQFSQRLANGPHRLACAVLVLDQGKADKFIPILPKPNSRRDGNLGLGKEKLGELDRAHPLTALGNLCPDKHRSLGFFDLPSDPCQAIDQGIAALTIELTNLFHAILRAVQRVNGGYLDWLKDPIIQVALDPGQGMDHFSVADGKAYPPPRHVITFGKREELDADLLGAGNLKEAWRLVAVEGDVRIGQIVDDEQLL